MSMGSSWVACQPSTPPAAAPPTTTAPMIVQNHQRLYTGGDSPVFPGGAASPAPVPGEWVRRVRGRCALGRSSRRARRRARRRAGARASGRAEARLCFGGRTEARRRSTGSAEPCLRPADRSVDGRCSAGRVRTGAPMALASRVPDDRRALFSGRATGVAARCSAPAACRQLPAHPAAIISNAKTNGGNRSTENRRRVSSPFAITKIRPVTRALTAAF